MAKRYAFISARRGAFGAAVLAAVCAFAGPAFGQLFVNSGYSKTSLPGNVLRAFGLEN